LNGMSAVLAIDTAAPRLQLALLRADGGVDVSIDDIAQGHAELLFGRLGALLARNGLAYADLDRVAVTTGPGSFTGVRIGLSAARGLALALGIPALGIPSLLAISLGASPGRPAAVLLDARRGEAYFQLFSAPGVPKAPPELLAMAEVRALLPHEGETLTSPFCDIARLARFALKADSALYPPHALYVRGADARPQDKARIPRAEVA
jgi:tRNA threonylcarbamoyladenosine biosynthesis protein TsaB